MNLYRCMGGGEKLVAGGVGTSAYELSLSGNTAKTLYASVQCASSNQSYRENSTNLSAYSGCTPVDLGGVTNGNVYTRFYKLTNCGANVSIAASSYGSSSLSKSIVITKVE